MNVGAAAVRGTEPDGWTLAVAAGDLVAIVGVLVAGMLRHDVNPVDAPDHAALVVAPFLVGWALLAVPAGAYAASARSTARGTVTAGVAAWVLAAVVGAAVRAVPAAWAPGGSPPVFVGVVIVSGSLAVGGWRTLVALGRIARTG